MAWYCLQILSLCTVLIFCSLWVSGIPFDLKNYCIKKLPILRLSWCPLKFCAQWDGPLVSPSFWPYCSPHSWPSTNVYCMNEAPSCEEDIHISVFKMRKGGVPAVAQWVKICHGHGCGVSNNCSLDLISTQGTSTCCRGSGKQKIIIINTINKQEYYFLVNKQE